MSLVSSILQKTERKQFDLRYHRKVWTKGTKFEKNLPLLIWRYSVVSNFKEKTFWKFCAFLRRSKLYVRKQKCPPWLMILTQVPLWWSWEVKSSRFYPLQPFKNEAKGAASKGKSASLVHQYISDDKNTHNCSE